MMVSHLPSAPPWGRTTPLAACRHRAPHAPRPLQQPGSPWQRLLRWLTTPAPLGDAVRPDGLDEVRDGFLCALVDVANEETLALRQRVLHAGTLRELWHLRADVFRAVGVAHSQAEAERRIAALNRHFPTRAPRSNWTPL